ncbi:MAG: hypothetical protein GF372_14910 [Candidatus Marinimicrobia bacterium]|nr:hypothetical protein [Candidatus Neomarinimicrobiota bacterium]
MGMGSPGIFFGLKILVCKSENMLTNQMDIFTIAPEPEGIIFREINYGISKR